MDLYELVARAVREAGLEDEPDITIETSEERPVEVVRLDFDGETYEFTISHELIQNLNEERFVAHLKERLTAGERTDEGGQDA